LIKGAVGLESKADDIPNDEDEGEDEYENESEDEDEDEVSGDEYAADDDGVDSMSPYIACHPSNTRLHSAASLFNTREAIL
jgi:hypothetical protein